MPLIGASSTTFSLPRSKDWPHYWLSFTFLYSLSFLMLIASMLWCCPTCHFWSSSMTLSRLSSQYDFLLQTPTFPRHMPEIWQLSFLTFSNKLLINFCFLYYLFVCSRAKKGDELPRNGPQCLCEIFFFYSFVLCAVHDTIFCLTHTFQMLESYFHLISLFSSFRSRTSSQSNPCESLQKTNSSWESYVTIVPNIAATTHFALLILLLISATYSASSVQQTYDFTWSTV